MAIGQLMALCGGFRRGREAADCGVVGRDKALLSLEGANLCVEYCKKFY